MIKFYNAAIKDKFKSMVHRMEKLEKRNVDLNHILVDTLAQCVILNLHRSVHYLINKVMVNGLLFNFFRYCIEIKSAALLDFIENLYPRLEHNHYYKEIQTKLLAYCIANHEERMAYLFRRGLADREVDYVLLLALESNSFPIIKSICETYSCNISILRNYDKSELDQPIADYIRDLIRSEYNYDYSPIEKFSFTSFDRSSSVEYIFLPPLGKVSDFTVFGETCYEVNSLKRGGQSFSDGWFQRMIGNVSEED